MAFLGILAASGDSKDAFAVERLHVNLWCLAAWWGNKRRTFVFDVGVRVRAGADKVSRLDIAVPFDTEKPISLWSKLQDNKTASLIFDAEIARRDGNTIFYEDKTLRLVDVAVGKAERDSSYTEPGFSLWKLELSQPIPANETRYFRVRFPVTGTGHTWQKTRLHGQTFGAVLDMRISDVRSSQSITNGNDLVPRIADIGSVAAFLIAPRRLHSRMLNPEPRYIRLLEGDIWSDYLDRAAEDRRGAQLVVYYWRSDARSSSTSSMNRAGPPSGAKVSGLENERKPSNSSSTDAFFNERSVTTEHPMRLYADLVWDSRPSRVWVVVWTAVATVGLMALLLDVTARPWVPSTLNTVGRWVSEASGWLLGGAAVTVATAIFNSVKPGRQLFRKVGAQLRRAEANHFSRARHNKK